MVSGRGTSRALSQVSASGGGAWLASSTSIGSLFFPWGGGSTGCSGGALGSSAVCARCVPRHEALRRLVITLAILGSSRWHEDVYPPARRHIQVHHYRQKKQGNTRARRGEKKLSKGMPTGDLIMASVTTALYSRSFGRGSRASASSTPWSRPGSHPPARLVALATGR